MKAIMSNPKSYKDTVWHYINLWI